MISDWRKYLRTLAVLAALALTVAVVSWALQPTDPMQGREAKECRALLTAENSQRWQYAVKNERTEQFVAECVLQMKGVRR
jgi:hypothetical protein